VVGRTAEVMPGVKDHAAVAAARGQRDLPGPPSVGRIGPGQELQAHQEAVIPGTVAYRREALRDELGGLPERPADEHHVPAAEGFLQPVELLLVGA
jgi:hypothetical protein